MTFASHVFHFQKRLHSRLHSTTHQLPQSSRSSLPSSQCLQNAGIVTSSPSPSRRQRGVHQHPHNRGIVTSSVAPALDVFIERPEVMVLAESSLYKHSWKDFSASFYPSYGLHFASVDIMKPLQKSSSGLYTDKNAVAAASLESLQQTMTKDFSHLDEVADADDLYVPGHAPPTSTSAHAVLIARGPIQCLIAQYFLESLPLAGLVLVDPLLLPVDGRAEKNEIESEESDTRWNTSLLDLISMLENRAPQMYNDAAQSSSLDGDIHPPLQLPSGMSIQSSDNTKQYDSTLEEISLLHSLANDENYKNNARSLKLEPGRIPTLVLYSGDHAYHDYYRICSERTAAFHTCGGEGDYFDQVSVLKIPKKNDESADDLDQVMGSIYEWYDEVVA